MTDRPKLGLKKQASERDPRRRPVRGGRSPMPPQAGSPEGAAGRRGGDRPPERGADRRPDRGGDRAMDRGPARGTDRGGERRPDRGPDRGDRPSFSRGPDLGPRPEGRRDERPAPRREGFTPKRAGHPGDERGGPSGFRDDRGFAPRGDDRGPRAGPDRRGGFDRPPRADWPDRGPRGDRPEGFNRPDRPDVRDRSPRPDRPRFDRPTDRTNERPSERSDRRPEGRFDGPRGPRVPDGRDRAPFDRPPDARDRSDRPPRPEGDRPARFQGERPDRSFGDRPARPFGDRAEGSGRRFDGDRPPPRRDRPEGPGGRGRVEGRPEGRPPRPHPGGDRRDSGRPYGADRSPPAAMAASTPEGIRLSKVMSDRGLSSRREADDWITAGWVKVNGRIAELGQRIRGDETIEVDPAAARQQAKRVTILLHKPLGYVSGQAEDGHEPASTLIRPANRWEDDKAGHWQPGHGRGLAPAGRLDMDSTGLLVLTQDGRIARHLIGEDSDVEKEYLVRVQPIAPGSFNPDDIERLREGLSLDGIRLRPAKVSWANEDQLRFVLREGRKRQIRRMCELVGLEVLALRRVRIGQISLGKLPPGQWRYLRDDERF